MTLVNGDRLAEFARKHPVARAWIESWRTVVIDAAWLSLQHVRDVYPSADGVKCKSGAIATVFNVKGNAFRLITLISYKPQVVDVVDLLTHADYSKDKWKGRL